MENNKEDYSKPGFDMRLEFNRHLKHHLDIIALYSYSGDVRKELEALGNYMALTVGFVTDREKYKWLKDRLLEMFRRCDRALALSSSHAVRSQLVLNKLKIDLLGFKEELFTLTRHLLLPVKSEDDDEFDADRFLKESLEG